MRVLVVGARGQVARSLIADRSFEGATIIARGRPELDITERTSIAAAIADAAPDVIINAAAYTAVDNAETEEMEALALNELGPAELAKQASARSIALIHISTDYVFDGSSDRPYSESDTVAPASAYGRSKLAGERAVAVHHPQSLIVRTAWVMSPYGRNFCKTMLRLAGERSLLRVVGDQIGSPTYAPHLAKALLTIASQITRDCGDVQWGTLHLANAGFASWYDVAVATMAEARRRDMPSVPVQAIATADYPTPARRPQNSRLNCKKAKAAFGITMPSWQDGVADCVAAVAGGTDEYA